MVKNRERTQPVSAPGNSGFGQPRRRGQSGQSLTETALLLPILLSIAFNAVNAGYFFYVMVNVSSAPRYGVQYSTMEEQYGFDATSDPTPTNVTGFVNENINGALKSATTTVVVCDSAQGTTTVTVGGTALLVTKCSDGVYTTDKNANAVDPEPGFVLNRVDVTYTVSPLIPGAVFNLILPSNMSFHRQVSMRSTS